jgi:hypothetical protein
LLGETARYHLIIGLIDVVMTVCTILECFVWSLFNYLKTIFLMANLILCVFMYLVACHV